MAAVALWAPTSAGMPQWGAAAERASQPAQRDELDHSQSVPIGDEVLPLTIDNPPPVTTGTLESLH